jgi:uncharacterized protein YbjT (DUF2867 family)
MGIPMRKMMRSRVIVVFGAMSRVGRATMHLLSTKHQMGITILAVCENIKSPHAKRLKKECGAFLVQCDFRNMDSIRRVIRHADAVFLNPTITESGTRFAKRLIDAIHTEDIGRLVLISSILATDDYWKQESTPNQGYESIEAHARSVLTDSVALRIPLLMDSILYCRDDILFGNKLFSCFDKHTAVPCIAVQDVATAAVEVLCDTTRTFNATYCLASSMVTCSPNQASQMLSTRLNRQIQYNQVPDDKYLQRLHDKGLSDQIGLYTIRLRNYLEAGGVVSSSTSTHDVGLAEDYRLITHKQLTSPATWLNEHLQSFMRTPQNTIQLFIVGAGDALYTKVERLIADKIISPESTLQSNEELIGAGAGAGSASGAQGIPPAGPNVSTGSGFSKTTFCTLKAGTQKVKQRSRQEHGRPPMDALLDQLGSLDVILLIPPICFRASECEECVARVIEAAKKANVWGIVYVSSIFTDNIWNDRINLLQKMEKMVMESGVSYTIVRLPIFMEYFLALCYPPNDKESRRPAQQDQTERNPEEPELEEKPSAYSSTQGRLKEPTGTLRLGREPEEEPELGLEWFLYDKSLDTSPQYLMSLDDAALALIAISYTFPMHQNLVRVLYSDMKTMREIDALLYHYVKKFEIKLGEVDGLKEENKREFWKIAYWTHRHMKQFFECEVELNPPEHIGTTVTFEELLGHPPMPMDIWVQRNANCFT